MRTPAREDLAYVRLRVTNEAGKDTADGVQVFVTEVRPQNDHSSEVTPIGLPLTWMGSEPPVTIAPVHPDAERHIDLLRVSYVSSPWAAASTFSSSGGGGSTPNR